MITGAYHVALTAFEGPFDLLLHLIARRKVDVYEIPLAQITEDYLSVLRGAELVDLEVATDFLVVAATLVELKAARLLPDEDDPELDELALEARDLLYARLLDYRTFREASVWLRRRRDAHAGFVARSVPLEEPFVGLRPPARLPVDAAGLAAVAARALADRPVPTVDVSHVRPLRMTVREAADLAVAALRRTGGRASFAQLTAGCGRPEEVVVWFLALLELYKLELVDLHQSQSFGVVTVCMSSDTPRPDRTLDALGEAAAASAQVGAR